MTLLGIAAGMAFYLSITAITRNLARETDDLLAGYNTDITVQDKRAGNPFSSRIRAHDYAELEKQFGDSVSPLVFGSLREEWNQYATVIGADRKMFARIGLFEGTLPQPGSKEVVIGSLLAGKIGLGVGQDLTLASDRYRITGIYSIGTRFIDGSVLMNIADAQQLLGSGTRINIALIRVKSSGDTLQTIQQINARFPKLRANQSSDFMKNSRLFTVITSCSQAVAVISFIGVCLIVTNTLLMAVGERTKEIGILMAIGWRPSMVLRMLFAESLALCFSGVLMGNGFALLILRIINNTRIIGFGWIPTTLPVETVVSSFGIALMLAAAAILWPSYIIYRLTPLEALRHE